MIRFHHFQIILLLSLAISFGFVSCNNMPVVKEPVQESLSITDTSPDFKVAYANHTGWTYNKGIYEVNIRQYTPEGTFKAFAGHLPRLKEMGVGILWLMPINPIGLENRKGSHGSYYSVQDYARVNPEFGSKDDFKSMVENAHKNGMYVLVDWVANHTSWDNTLTTSNPEFYLRKDDGSFQPPPGHEDWTDVIQLDYSNPDVQDYMVAMLKKWVVETGIDGYRFDYVDGVPVEFWKRAIRELKGLKPDIFLLAEGDGVKYHQMGFDMDYCWALHGWDSGIMRQIYEGKKDVFDLDAFLSTEKTNYMPEKYRMYFTSNHDENSWHGTEFEQLGQSAEVFAALTHTLYGMPLVYSGQEAGMDKRLEFFTKDQINWNNLVYEKLYSKLNHLRDTCQALWNGAAGAIPMRIGTSLDESVFAFVRSKNNSMVIVMLNLEAETNSFSVESNGYNGTYYDIISDTTFELSDKKPVTLKAWGYRVLVRK
ncbi:MAG: alpha-glucosidase C-terminal domain-containing protein [Bacteroidales bacterium]|nr:alpha-glucosidase C-terminal domain-containing protein [Bacteroidales bacterium]